ncbi:hypothetical protein KIN20_007866 [Parelaphostrongylus tenuis]|uniref:Uncharacterized protein n=1 Tax=Parelaphostrongylus tenuis TaxID=148309 RepID=A0AAD5M3Z0_PARTN|nr:hypothetical protein KIN20_007866 [Parelaphostrongylus tenuis]
MSSIPPNPTFTTIVPNVGRLRQRLKLCMISGRTGYENGITLLYSTLYSHLISNSSRTYSVNSIIFSLNTLTVTTNLYYFIYVTFGNDTFML